MPDPPVVDPAEVLAAAVWNDDPLDPRTARGALARAWEIAVANEVGADLARHYPDQLRSEHDEAERRWDLFRARLGEAAGILRSAGVPAVLIKTRLGRGDVYANFDLVVGPRRFHDALAALRGWAVRTETHPLEPDKVLLHPEHGPAAHLHQHVGWFGIPVITGRDLIARATPDPAGPWLRPDAADDLRSYLAHAAYQNLSVPLRELRAVRGRLGDGEPVGTAGGRAEAEGWGRTFEELVQLVGAACRDLDAGRVPRMPLPLPGRLAFSAGWEHGTARWRRGQRVTALRELALRGPLVMAKVRRRWQGR